MGQQAWQLVCLLPSGLSDGLHFLRHRWAGKRSSAGSWPAAAAVGFPSTRNNMGTPSPTCGTRPHMRLVEAECLCSVKAVAILHAASAAPATQQQPAGAYKLFAVTRLDRQNRLKQCTHSWAVGLAGQAFAPHLLAQLKKAELIHHPIIA